MSLKKKKAKNFFNIISLLFIKHTIRALRENEKPNTPHDRGKTKERSKYDPKILWFSFFLYMDKIYS